MMGVYLSPQAHGEPVWRALGPVQQRAAVPGCIHVLYRGAHGIVDRNAPAVAGGGWIGAATTIPTHRIHRKWGSKMATKFTTCIKNSPGAATTAAGFSNSSITNYAYAAERGNARGRHHHRPANPLEYYLAIYYYISTQMSNI